MINKQSMINWLIVNQVDMTSNKISLPDEWCWTSKDKEGYYGVSCVDKKVQYVVRANDVCQEILKRLKRNNIDVRGLVKC